MASYFLWCTLHAVPCRVLRRFAYVHLQMCIGAEKHHTLYLWNSRSFIWPHYTQTNSGCRGSEMQVNGCRCRTVLPLISSSALGKHFALTISAIYFFVFTHPTARESVIWPAKQTPI